MSKGEPQKIIDFVSSIELGDKVDRKQPLIF
jgi:hypothetical protein